MNRERQAADLEAVKKHVSMLIDVHHTHRTICTASGVSPETLRCVLYRHKGILPRTRDALLSVEVRPPWETPGLELCDRDRVSAVGTARRIRALVRMGYPVSHIARRHGLSSGLLRKLVQRPHSLVRLQTAEQIAGFYRSALRNIPEGLSSDRARRWAESQGWPGPGAWDDIDRDEVPEEEGNMGVLLEFIRDYPGLTVSEIRQRIRSELGMQGITAERLIKEALGNGEIKRVRDRRTVRVYATA